jgi:putative tryptophan/tyrosine transport system substrate-binding protein
MSSPPRGCSHRSSQGGTPRPRRRDFLRGLARSSLVLAAVAPMTGCDSQPSAKTPRVGFLATGSREGRGFLVDSFLRGLRERGYVEGQTIEIEYRFSDAQDERLPALAAELVERKVDVILASGTPATFAAKRATSTIPIVMPASAADPVATGLVASFANPGGNITGLSALTAGLAGKRLELLRGILPNLGRVAVFWNPTNPTYGPVLVELKAVAPALGVQLQLVEVRVPEDFPGAFEAAAGGRAEAMLVPGDPLTTNRPARVAELALQARLPTMMEFRQFVLAGGLLSYGVNLVDLYRRAAGYVDKILKGAHPSNLPLQEPELFDFAINLTTAQALGLAIPDPILARATEVIP